jgi:hypothetical protein
MERQAEAGGENRLTGLARLRPTYITEMIKGKTERFGGTCSEK